MALNPGAAKVSFGFKKAGSSSSGSSSSPITSIAGGSKPSGFKLSGSLGGKLKQESFPKKPPGLAAGFGSPLDDEDEQDRSIQGDVRGKKKKTATPYGTAAVPASVTEKRVQDAALQVDESIFDYDAAYEKMQQAKRMVQERKDTEKAERKPKYIASILESAEIRKRDHARAEAKMIQREREREGDEYEGTEAFVTDAYRAQLEEIKKLEEKEAKEEEEQRKRAAKAGGTGGASFMKDMLKAQDQDHAAIVAAAAEAAKQDKGKGRATDEPEAPRKKSDLELARDARAKGLKVEVNDEGELVDKRDVLSKGLNVIRDEKSDRQGPDLNMVRNRVGTGGSSGAFDERASADARRAQRARQTKLIEEQMMEQERLREEEARREEEERKKKYLGTATEEDVKQREEKLSAARQRALERKRKREEEQAKSQQ